MGRWKQSGDDTGPENRSETNSELEIRNSQLCPGLCSKDPQTNNSMERVITLPSLRSLGLQLKCFELVLLPKAAPPALQTPPQAHFPQVQASSTQSRAGTCCTSTCVSHRRKWEGGKGQEEEKPFFWELCWMKILNNESGNYDSKATQKK